LKLCLGLRWPEEHFVGFRDLKSTSRDAAHNYTTQSEVLQHLFARQLRKTFCLMGQPFYPGHLKGPFPGTARFQRARFFAEEAWGKKETKYNRQPCLDPLY